MQKLLLYLVLFSVVNLGTANPADSLTFTNIGKSLLQGSYSVKQGVHSLSGAGSDVWNKADDFDFTSIKLSGDMQITARIVSTEHINESTKSGIMIRNNVSSSAMFAFMYYSPKTLGFDYRILHRYSCRNNEISNVIKLPYWVKIIRTGDMFISQRSVDGINWNTVEIKTINMDDTVCYGLAVCSHDTSLTAVAEFDHVSIEKFNSPLSHEMKNAIVKSCKLYSKYIKDTFEIYIGLPLNYDGLKPKTYPVAYHLDGGNVNDHHIIRNYITDKLVPEVITVGIGYTQSLNQRERDYRGGFDKFYLFMKNELIPFIDKCYKTNPLNRTLYGYSYGGLGSMQTLYKYADEGDGMPFQGIIAGSPALWWRFGNSNFSYRREVRIYEKSKTLPINLYMCIGTAEYSMRVRDFKKMTKLLDGRAYKDFNFKHQLNTGLNHDSNKKVSFKEGYLWLLNQPLPVRSE